MAGFLGVSNLLDGEVVKRNSELAEVRLSDGTPLRVPASLAGDMQRVRVGVRPEKLKVSPGAAMESDMATNCLIGRVLDASYIGVSTQYLVRTGDGHELTVYSQNLETAGSAEVLAAGEMVCLSWKPQHSFVIAARSESAPAPEGAIDA